LFNKREELFGYNIEDLLYCSLFDYILETDVELISNLLLQGLIFFFEISFFFFSIFFISKNKKKKQKKKKTAFQGQQKLTQIFFLKKNGEFVHVSINISKTQGSLLLVTIQEKVFFLNPSNKIKRKKNEKRNNQK